MFMVFSGFEKILLGMWLWTRRVQLDHQNGKQTRQESVLSVTETVSVPAGTFTNCLKISDTHFDSTGTAVFREYSYYAYGIGLVKTVRTLPDSQAHSDELIGYVTTGISDGAANQRPQEFSLSQNYPNPFNPSTQINYQLPVGGIVSLRVYDILGRTNANLVDGAQQAGYHTATWNGSTVGSGVYFCRLSVRTSDGKAFNSTKKMLLTK